MSSGKRDTHNTNLVNFSDSVCCIPQNHSMQPGETRALKTTITPRTTQVFGVRALAAAAEKWEEDGARRHGAFVVTTVSFSRDLVPRTASSRARH
jgi:hypothetical protein